MKLQKISQANVGTYPKPKRSIYGGRIYHNTGFSLNKKLFGNSYSPQDRQNKKQAIRLHNDAKRTRLRVSTNEYSTSVEGTIEESIRDVGLYPVVIIVEQTDGSIEEWLVTRE